MAETASADVSVIIPAYRAAGTIGRALRSVAAQTLPPREVVIVDDGSDDGTDDAVEAMRPEMGGIELVLIRQENKGAGAARNRALAETRATYVAFLDADDEWLPRKLERSMAVLAAGGFDLVAHDYLDATERGDIHVDCRARFESGDDPFVSLYLKGYIPSISVVTRLATVQAAGGFDETLRNAQDFDLWLAVLADPSRTFTVFGEALARYHHTAGGIMSHTERRIACCTRVALRYLPALTLRGENPRSLLVRRLAVVYGEAFAAYRGAGRPVRAMALPLRLMFRAVTVFVWPKRTDPRGFFLGSGPDIG